MLLCAGLLATAPVFAQTPAAKKEAGTHYQRGVGLYKEANYGAALAEFRAAQQAVPSFEVLFNIGLCERRLFKYGQAIRTLNTYLQEGGPKVPKDRRAAVAQELEQIRQLTAPVAVIVAGAPAKLLVDGELYGTTPLTEMVPLGPGQHVVRAERDGHAPDEKRIEVVSGQPQAVQLEPRSLTAPVAVTIESDPPGALVSIDGAAALKVPATHPIAPGNHEFVARLDGYAPSRSDVEVKPGEPRSVRVALVALPPPPAPRPFPKLGVSLLGGGVVLGAVGGVFAWQANAAGQKVAALAKSNGTWDPSWARVEASGKQFNTVAWALLGTGAASLAVGAVLTGLGLQGDAAPAPAVAVMPDFQGGGSVSCAVHF